MFNSSSKFGAGFGGKQIDQEAVLQAAKDIFMQQQKNREVVEEANRTLREQAGDSSGEDSDSVTDSQEDMSFTSEDENEDAVNILGLCLEQERRKQALKPTPEQAKKSKKNEKVSVVLNTGGNDSNDLSKFNTDSKQLIKDQGTDLVLKNLFVTEDENAVIEQFEREKHTEIERELGT